MGLRGILQQNQLIAAVVATIIVGISIALMVLRQPQPSAPEQIYFYDLGTRQLFPAERGARPPIDAPSGPDQGVMAFVYSCGACDPADLHVSYVTSYDEPAQDALAKMTRVENVVDPALATAVEQGTYVAVPVDETSELTWVSAFAPEGIAIMERHQRLCGDQPARRCFP